MTKIPTYDQVSAGGVAYRQVEGRTEITIILVEGRGGKEDRWQLPKGLVGEGEAPEVAALREVREEAGVEAELIGLIETVEYWYYDTRGVGRIRYHKFVHFYLMRYRSGDVADHDHEVKEARWAPIEEAPALLAFKSEQEVVQKAQAMIAGLSA